MNVKAMDPEYFSPGGRDSTNRVVRKGDKVRWRGETYTVRGFLPGEGRFDTARVVFETEPHLDEVPDEIGIDLIPRSRAG
tara:strand:- start:218 stop:457 length:240 start_codon:yes stop_codon:yes gene_type:complete